MVLFSDMFLNIYFYLFIWHRTYDSDLKCIFQKYFLFVSFLSVLGLHCCTQAFSRCGRDL